MDGGNKFNPYSGVNTQNFSNKKQILLKKSFFNYNTESKPRNSRPPIQVKVRPIGPSSFYD